MKRTLVAAGGLLTLVFLLTACTFADAGVRGSGDVITESRPVSGFDRVVVAGLGRVLIEVTGTESLEIEAEDNILPLLRTGVRDGRLELEREPGRTISPTRDIVFRVTAISLAGIEVLGSGEVTAWGVQEPAIEVSISGSGRVEVDGAADALTLEISGSGDYQGEGLRATSGVVTVSGSGSAVVDVTDSLDVTISGSGTVEYLGSPTLRQAISGSGEVSQR